MRCPIAPIVDSVLSNSVSPFYVGKIWSWYQKYTSIKKKKKKKLASECEVILFLKLVPKAYFLEIWGPLSICLPLNLFSLWMPLLPSCPQSQCCCPWGPGGPWAPPYACRCSRPLPIGASHPRDWTFNPPTSVAPGLPACFFLFFLLSTCLSETSFQVQSQLDIT